MMASGVFDSIVAPGIASVYAHDFEIQKDYIAEICEDVRDMKSDIVLKAHGFFVPNDDYIKYYFGPAVCNPDYEIYNVFGECIWTHNLVFPITNVVGKVVGFAGFNPFRYLEAHETNNWGLNYYTYSSKAIFNKGNYLFMLPDIFEKSVREGYIVIADGLFDTLSFAGADFNSGGLLGSFVSDQIIATLRFINTIIVAMDNDEAGLKLYNRLNKRHPNVILFKQGIKKDADDILKSNYREPYIKKLKEIINNQVALQRVVCFSKTRIEK